MITKEDIYINPEVSLLHVTPLAVAEVAARSAYDSFDKSEHEIIKSFPLTHKLNYDIPDSKIMNTLAWTYFHHSVLEHLVLQFHIRKIGRGVLQELARHRIASPTVKSTRYTLGPILIAFVVSKDEQAGRGYHTFQQLMKRIRFSVLKNEKLQSEEVYSIYSKLEVFYKESESDFLSNVMSKAQLDIAANIDAFDTDEPEYFFDALMQAKSKRNVGDKFKMIVSDNFATELVWTINLRALKNFLDLRDSGSAWFPMQELAKEMKRHVPKQYLELIVKEK